MIFKKKIMKSHGYNLKGKILNKFGRFPEALKSLR